MSALLERLRAAGADIDGAMGRFLDDEELYAECFDAFIHDPCFEKLEEALASGDYGAAFDAAHTLKGVAGNMGLSGIYQAASALVEPLREKRYSELQPLYDKVVLERESLKQLKR